LGWSALLLEGVERIWESRWSFELENLDFSKGVDTDRLSKKSKLHVEANWTNFQTSKLEKKKWLTTGLRATAPGEIIANL
jgi:hypothetical protein